MLKVYKYKDGNVVFINNERLLISDQVAKVIEANLSYTDDLYKDAGVKQIEYMLNTDEEELKMAQLVEIETVKKPSINSEVSFFIYKGIPMKFFGIINGQDAEAIAKGADVQKLYEDIKNLE